MKIKTTDELQGPNLMQSRHGESANPLQKCAQCQHPHSCHDFGDTLDFWVCEKLTTPGGHNMAWSAENRAWGLWEERTE